MRQPWNVTTTATPAATVEFHSNVKYAFWLSSGLLVPIAVAFLYLSRSSPKGGDAARVPDNETNAFRRKGFYHNAVVALAFIFLLIYVGLEVAYGGYLFSYAVKYCPLQFSESKAAVLTSVYWGFFAFGRLLAIPLSLKLPASAMTVLDLFGVIVSSMVMLVARDNATLLWFGTAAFGMSMASMFPCMMNLLEQYIDMTGRTASIIVVGAALGEMILSVDLVSKEKKGRLTTCSGFLRGSRLPLVCRPLTLGSIFGAVGPESFTLVVFLATLLSAVAFIAFLYHSYRGKASYLSQLARKSLRSKDIGGDGLFSESSCQLP